MPKFSLNIEKMPIISRFSRYLAQSCQFREAETNKQLAATTSGSTRFECGVLKFLHDLGGGAKILHDYLISP